MRGTYDFENSPYHLSVIIPSESEQKGVIKMSISGDRLLFRSLALKVQNQMCSWKNNFPMSKNYDFENSPYRLSVIIPSELEQICVIKMSISGDRLLFR